MLILCFWLKETSAGLVTNDRNKTLSAVIDSNVYDNQHKTLFKKKKIHLSHILVILLEFSFVRWCSIRCCNCLAESFVHMPHWISFVSLHVSALSTAQALKPKCLDLSYCLKHLTGFYYDWSPNWGIVPASQTLCGFSSNSLAPLILQD